MSFLKSMFCAVVLSVLLPVSMVHAGAVVRISTTYGDFSVEMVDNVAPANVQNFLNYVNDGDYNGTFFHRLESGFVLQGGGFRFVPFSGAVQIPLDPAVVNEFNISNTRGTLAMAKLGDQPNSATSQFFINLADNSANLDNQNGGFTVFARVLGDGMNVVDAIAANPVYNLGAAFGATPLRADTAGNLQGPGGLQANNFITMSAVVTQRHSSALHVFEYSTGRLITSVDGGTEGAFSLNLQLVADSPNIVFELNQSSMVPLAVKPTGMSTFSSSDNRLRIPVIELNNNGAVAQITNAVFVLSNPALLRFTLESYDQ